MKELSIEEKAKRYDEAIEVARKIKNGEPINVPDGTLIPVAIFPELRESEDERIRKALIDYFNDFTLPTFEGLEPKKILAWLEKQGEQKPAWSEEDEYYYGIVQYILNNECVGKADRENAITWYNFLKDRVQPQPKQEWSEEDEDMLYKATAVINRLCAEGKEYVWSIKTLKKLFFWLKSLRPQSHWKPSDEQIKAIKWVMDGDNPENWSITLKNLYQNLKKLKG